MEDNRNSETKKVEKMTKIALGASLFLCACTLIMYGITFKMMWDTRSKVYDIKYETSDDTMKEIKQLYKKYYIKGDYDEEKAVQGSIAGYVAGIGDKYGNYFEPEIAKKLQDDMEGSYVGLGIQVAVNKDTQLLDIKGITPNSPAEKAGVKVGGNIVKVNNTDVNESNYNSIVNAMRGKEGDSVDISVNYSGETSDYTLIRERIEVKDIEYKVIDNVGYIKINGFKNNTNEHFQEALKFMGENKISKFIFDLRDNSGGLVDTVVPMVDSIVPEGLIARVVDKNGKETVYNSDSSELNGDMVVLTNRNTASAAELFTLNMREYNKATIIGEKTFGKGTQIIMHPLKNGGELSLSDGMYYTKSIPNIEGVGIKPDIELKKTDEEGDNQLAKALEVIKNK